MSVVSDQPAALRRPRRRTEEVRQLILDAARRAFAERGFAGASTRLIAADAGVTQALIFSNFGSKADLFSEAVIAPFNARLAAFLSDSAAMPPDRELRSAGYVHALYPFLRDNAGLLHALVRSAGDVQPEALAGLGDYFATAAGLMRAQYEARGLHFDLPPELLVRYGFGMLAGSVLLRDWFFPGEAPSEAIAEAALARLMFKASEPLHPEAPPSITCPK